MQGDVPRPAEVPPGRPSPGEDSAPGAPSQEGTRVASSRWNQGCMRCPAGKRRQGGRRGGRGGCRAASAAVVFWEAGPERPQGRGRPMLRSKLSSDRLPSELPSPQVPPPPLVWTEGLGPPGAGAEAQQNRAELTIAVRVTQEVRRRGSARSLRGGRSLPVKRVWRRGLERGEGGPRWDARQPGEPSEHRAGTGHRGAKGTVREEPPAYPLPRLVRNQGREGGQLRGGLLRGAAYMSGGPAFDAKPQGRTGVRAGWAGQRA